MNRIEAQEFFLDHAEWLANSWGMTPEGRDYKSRFDNAVEAIMKPDALHVPDVHVWKETCTVILRQSPGNGWRTHPYVQAIKITRETFGCTLIEGKIRVDALRAELRL